MPDPKKPALSVRQNDTQRQDITTQKCLVVALKAGKAPDMASQLRKQIFYERVLGYGSDRFPSIGTTRTDCLCPQGHSALG
ncbi:MAG: hypothetical protein AMK69_27285 [Nitrospira bacterium SG8_3]|nr:MAG: hypothetical protein AMK69_27285 [Nitrospira bacterium SG8_3]